MNWIDQIKRQTDDKIQQEQQLEQEKQERELAAKIAAAEEKRARVSKFFEICAPLNALVERVLKDLTGWGFVVSGPEFVGLDFDEKDGAGYWSRNSYTVSWQDQVGAYQTEYRYTVDVMRWTVEHPELHLRREVDVAVDAETMSPVFCGKFGKYSGTEEHLKSSLESMLEQYFRATTNKS